VAEFFEDIRLGSIRSLLLHRFAWFSYSKRVLNEWLKNPRYEELMKSGAYPYTLDCFKNLEELYLVQDSPNGRRVTDKDIEECKQELKKYFEDRQKLLPEYKIPVVSITPRKSTVRKSRY
jgi:hypothetical protein